MAFGAITSLFSIGGPTRGIKEPGKEEVALEFDAVITETPGYSATATTNAVEDGTDISDNVNLAPETLSLECVVSNNPVTLERAAAAASVGAVTNLLPGAAAGIALTAAGSLAGLLVGSSDPAKAAFDFLEELYRNREPFDLQTGLKLYTNHVITSIGIARTAQNANALEFTLTTQKITIVQSATVLLPAFKVAQTAAASASSKQKQGRQGTKDATESGERKTSLLLAGLQGAGVF